MTVLSLRTKLFNAVQSAKVTTSIISYEILDEIMLQTNGMHFFSNQQRCERIKDRKIYEVINSRQIHQQYLLICPFKDKDHTEN